MENILFLVEMGIVAVIVVIQFFVFFRNLAAINGLSGIFPKASALKTKNVPDAIPGEDGEIIPTTLDLIDENPGFSGTFKNIVRNYPPTFSVPHPSFFLLQQDLFSHQCKCNLEAF